MNNPLFQLRDVLRRRGMASAAQLAAELRLPAGVVEDMIAHWMRRGMVAGAEASAAPGCGSGGGCSSCGQCASAAAPAVLYRWHEAEARRPARSIPILAQARAA